MKKTQLAVLTLLAAVATVPIALQHRHIHRLTAANQELRNVTERSRTELNELKAVNERLRDDVAKAQSELNELAKLRGDVARLRRDLDKASERSTSAQTKLHSPTTHPNSQGSFGGTAQASLEPGQTLVMGGWPTASGKRTLTLVTPNTVVDGQHRTVFLESVYVQMPETALSASGWERFQAVTQDATPSGVFDPSQTKQFLDAVRNMQGADVLGSPRVATASGQPATISISDPNGAKLELSLVPVLAANGRTMELSVSNSIAVPPGP